MMARMGNNLTILKVNHEVRDDEEEREEEGFVFIIIIIIIIIVIIIIIAINIIKEGRFAAALNCLVLKSSSQSSQFSTWVSLLRVSHHHNLHHCHL